MRTHRIALLEGGGIGPVLADFWHGMLPVLAEKHGFAVDCRVLPFGKTAFKSCGEAAPRATLDAILEADVALLVAVDVKDLPESPVGRLRRELDLYADIVIDNGGMLDTSCWGGILANGAKMKGVSGIVVDGAVRDLDDIMDVGFAAYARGTVVATARGRIMEESTNAMIEFADVQVRPGDVILADSSGVAVIPQEELDNVLAKAEEFFAKEEAMIAEIRAGKSMLEVDQKYNYEQMLKK